MKLSKIGVIILFLVALAAIPAWILSYDMPDKIVTHWNARGEADGSMPKTIGLYFVPGMMVFFSLLLIILPNFFPLKSNFKQAKAPYHVFLIVFNIFFLLIQIHVLLWNTGRQINPFYFMSVGIFLLFYTLGFVLSKVKRNWIIGIRTAWTLHSDRVWDKTHEKAGPIFKACAFIALAGIFFKNLAIWLILVPVFGAVIYLSIYSYLEFKKEEAEGGPKTDKKSKKAKKDKSSKKK